jgi:formylglycine-generating enzyme required for sulfatase activity
LREEFVYAAKGTNPQRPYAWDGPYLRNSRGLILCNFLYVDSLTAPRELNNMHEGPDSKDLIAPSVSFWPSEFGLYNLNGNVAEMVSEKGKAVGGDWSCKGNNVQNESVKTYVLPDPTIGFRPVMTVVR